MRRLSQVWQYITITYMLHSYIFIIIFKHFIFYYKRITFVKRNINTIRKHTIVENVPITWISLQIHTLWNGGIFCSVIKSGSLGYFGSDRGAARGQTDVLSILTHPQFSCLCIWCVFVDAMVCALFVLAWVVRCNRARGKTKSFLQSWLIHVSH